MTRLLKSVFCLGLALCLVFGSFTGMVFADSDDTVVILYENDVHCAVDGYSKLAALKASLTTAYSYVGVVSCGDFVQGGTLGAVSKGEYIVKLMNLVGYDAIALGNHEFDYQIPRLEELCALSSTPYLSCNFMKIDDNVPFFSPYSIVSYGTTDIAYIGITTPDTLHSSKPIQFRDQYGNIIYTFRGTDLHEAVQTSIDAAKAAGADYIIALSHIGYAENGGWSDITDLIGRTVGLDAVLDAHSHSVIEKLTVKDKAGNDVLLSSTGTKFEHIGKLTVTKDGLNTALIPVASLTDTDPAVEAYIKQINEEYSSLGNRKIGESTVDLITHDASGVRLVRKGETNLGNFCADALLTQTGADIAYVNGGGLRAPLGKGEVTFNDIYSVFPFNNQIMTAQITGQILLDMLETGVMNYPEEDGSFPHTAGITFAIDTSVPSPVKMDENGYFIGVEGERRVYDVKVFDDETATYQPLDPQGTYVLTAFNYYLVDFGGGMAMLKDAVILDDEGTLDLEVLESYITDALGGVIGDSYAQLAPRITFTNGKSTPDTGTTVPSDTNSDGQNNVPKSPPTGDRTNAPAAVICLLLALVAAVKLACHRSNAA